MERAWAEVMSVLSHATLLRADDVPPGVWMAMGIRASGLTLPIIPVPLSCTGVFSGGETWGVGRQGSDSLWSTLCSLPLVAWVARSQHCSPMFVQDGSLQASWQSSESGNIQSPQGASSAASTASSKASSTAVGSGVPVVMLSCCEMVRVSPQDGCPRKKLDGSCGNSGGH